MKRVLLLNLFYSSLFVILSFTQLIPQEDPFRINETGPVTVKSQDIFLLWMEDIDQTSGTNYKSYQKVYRYKTDGIMLPLDSLDIDTMITKTSRRENSRSGKNVYVDVASGKFNRDPYDDAVSIWRTTNSNQKIEIMISHFDTTGFFTNSTAISLDAGEDIRQDDEIYVRTGNFDSDSTDEFIVAYRDASDSVIFCIYDVDSTLQTTLVNRFSNVKVVGSGLTHFVKYYIETADLNDDGIDELISFTWESSITTSVPITVQVYAFEGNNIVVKGTTVIQVPALSQTTLQDFIMASAKGQFDSDQSDELVFSAVAKFLSNNLHVSHHYILNISQNLQTISVGPRGQYTLSGLNNHNTNGLTEFALASGDLNNTYNKRDEVVFAAGDKIRVTEIGDNYNFITRASIGVLNGGGSDYLQSNNYLKVSDLNMDNWEDIIIVKNIVAGTTNQGFLTAVATFTDSTLNEGTERVFARLLADEGQNDTYHQYAITVGNFDGFDFTIGHPTKTTVYGTVEPVVILNAPPVHFDKFGNNIFDINSCYNGNDCDFVATYQGVGTTSTEVTIESHKDWQVSAGIRLKGEYTVAPMGVGIATEYELWGLYTHGTHFSKSSTTGETLTISVTIDARDDDRIYSIIEDTDVYEYPVFHGNEEVSRRSYFAFVPHTPVGTWFGSKSNYAMSIVPDHEVSNILSYYDSLTNNPDVDQLLETRGSDRFVVDGTSSYNKNWTLERFTNVQADTVRENGADAGVKFIVEATFKFSKKKVSTSKTTIKSGIDLNVKMGNLNTGYGNAEYAVTPYAYWNKDDALILDYAVQPTLGGGLPTWWEVMYGNNPDPTFTLPWKLDPEKGYTLIDEDQRFLTKDIIFSNKYPDQDDTITITTLVHNLSLLPTPTPITIKYYFDDPDSGGIPIIGVNGTNEASTVSNILARGRTDVDFNWVVPAGLPQYPRIYAVLDPDNAITEIHENNNKGFNILGASAVSGVEEERYIIPAAYALYQSYPNPFNPSTTIKYSLPNSDIVSLKVFDILGREVAILLDEYKTAGTHAVEFNASGLSSGVYFYQLHSGNFVETKKMVLIK